MAKGEFARDGGEADEEVGTRAKVREAALRGGIVVDLNPGPSRFAEGASGRTPLGRYSGQTVIAVGAHPDDLELGIGGTLALLARGGARVVGVIFSVPNKLEERYREARAAAGIVGMSELRFLLPGTSRIEDVKSYELSARLETLVRELRPAALLSHSPADFHRDHVLVHSACQETCAALREDLEVPFFDFFTYYPTMTRPVAVDFHPRIYVDISEAIDLKMEAINAYSSQFQLRDLETDFCRAQAREHGRRIGVKYAEALQVVRMKLS